MHAYSNGECVFAIRGEDEAKVEEERKEMEEAEGEGEVENGAMEEEEVASGGRGRVG